MDAERVVIDTERVIAEVRARPEIWDPSHDLYKSRESRQLAWRHVARALLLCQPALDAAAQRDIEKKIQQRWRTARDSYVKSRANAMDGGAGKDRGYGYYEAMRFLEPTLRLPLKVLARRERAGRVRRDNGAHCRNGIGGGRAEPLPAPSADLATLLRPHQSPLDEDDDHFFKSLAPLLRTLRTHQKLAFRSRVLALALEVQEGADPTEAAPPDLPADRHPDTKHRPSPSPPPPDGRDPPS